MAVGPLTARQHQKMQKPAWQQPTTGSNNVTAHCTLLQQLSQDLLDKTPVALNTGCDSSDCLLCQGQRQFCNQSITTNTVCTWLGRRRLSNHTSPVCSSQLSTAGRSSSNSAEVLMAAEQQEQHEPTQQLQGGGAAADDGKQGQRKRLKLSPTPSTPVCSTGASDASTTTAAAAAGAPHMQDDAALQPQQDSAVDAQQEQQQQQEVQQNAPAYLCSASLLSGRETWCWQPAYATLEDPAPAQLTEVARLQSAADACTGHSTGRSDRISGLEFSPDGQLVATAGVSKQVGLYPLAPLAELQDAAGVVGGPSSNSSSSSSQRQQRLLQQQQQPWQQQSVPLLPPVATVRLPGKVSSIAFSPDMQGVISIGDYDGTLTQVHVASGHHLNEVDAHAGRRIWSLSHSKLRRHFAATASDDCTARLWSGTGLNTHVATISPPGKPAVCGVDFSSSNEFLLALAAADAKVYVYDLRQLQQPMATLHGHRRAVSYAKFFGEQRLVSASVDGTLAVWDLAPVLGLSGGVAPAAAAAAAAQSTTAAAVGPSPANSNCCSSGACSDYGSNNTSSNGQLAASCAAVTTLQQPTKVFRGHKNEKNFVGLAVEPTSGLMAVGSEMSEVFSYHSSWSSPLARFDMGGSSSQLQQQMQQPVSVEWNARTQQQQQQQSVSAVAWQPPCEAASARAFVSGSCGPATLLAAATSAGACRLLTLVP